MREEGRPGHTIVLTVAAIGFLVMFVLALFASTEPPDRAPFGPTDLFTSDPA